MELVAAALAVAVVIEAMLIYRFRRRADLLKQAMERDRATFMRIGHPAPKGGRPEPTVGSPPESRPRPPAPEVGEERGEGEPT